MCYKLHKYRNFFRNHPLIRAIYFKRFLFLNPPNFQVQSAGLLQVALFLKTAGCL